MKIETEILSVALSQKEVDILISAQTIINTILIELGKANNMSSIVERLYDNVYDAISNLDEIINVVDVEN